LAQPVEANEVFVALPEHLVAKLERAGFAFYRWRSPPGVQGPVIRLVTSFQTTTAEVDALLEAAGART
jgi:threonine aldolase